MGKLWANASITLDVLTEHPVKHPFLYSCRGGWVSLEVPMCSPKVFIKYLRTILYALRFVGVERVIGRRKVSLSSYVFLGVRNVNLKGTLLSLQNGEALKVYGRELTMILPTVLLSDLERFESFFKRFLVLKDEEVSQTFLEFVEGLPEEAEIPLPQGPVVPITQVSGISGVQKEIIETFCHNLKFDKPIRLVIESSKEWKTTIEGTVIPTVKVGVPFPQGRILPFPEMFKVRSMVEEVLC